MTPSNVLLVYKEYHKKIAGKAETTVIVSSAEG